MSTAFLILGVVCLAAGVHALLARRWLVALAFLALGPAVTLEGLAVAGMIPTLPEAARYLRWLGIALVLVVAVQVRRERRERGA